LDRILEREVYQYARREKKFVPFALLEEAVVAAWEAPERDQPEVVALRREQSREVMEAVRQLPPTLREVVERRYFSDSQELEAEKLAWIADQMGRAESSVRVYHRRALAALRKSLQAKEGKSA
jgi:DNA-directed RNA polymerase specialized sigma24 family protein